MISSSLAIGGRLTAFRTLVSLAMFLPFVRVGELFATLVAAEDFWRTFGCFGSLVVKHARVT